MTQQRTYKSSVGKHIGSLSLLCCLLMPVAMRSQDIHFSQIDVNPILLNPAYSGFFNGTGRFGAIYRNQWASVGRAYQTMAASAEVSLMRRKRRRDGLNLGLYAYTDNAGELHYGTSSATAALSYFLSLDSRSSTFLSAAVEVGCGQSGFDPSNASLFDESESFENTSTFYPLLGAGLAFFYQPNDDFYLKCGVSGRNLNRPNISYAGLEDTYLNRKWTAYARAEFRAWSSVGLLPVLLCQWQNNYSEYVAGADAKWYISENSGEQISFSGGLRYRWRDALYTEYTFEYNSLLVSLAYDANLSRLTPASRSLGAFELGVVYRINSSQNVRRKAMPCPVI